MQVDHADFFPRRANLRVPNMVYSADVDITGYVLMDLGATATVDADGILDGVSIADAGEVEAADFAAAYSSDSMGKYGRNLTVVASGVATSKVTAHGLDYLGQPMSEEFTLNGNTPVVGKKAFKHVTVIEFAATADRTIDLGWGSVLGLPYACNTMERELVNDATPADAGTFVAAVATQTITSGDPRGTYTPHSNNAPNGSRVHKVIAYAVPGNLHGSAHFAS